jgi:hypothetical protein
LRRRVQRDIEKAISVTENSGTSRTPNLVDRQFGVSHPLPLSTMYASEAVRALTGEPVAVE